MEIRKLNPEIETKQPQLPPRQRVLNVYDCAETLHACVKHLDDVSADNFITATIEKKGNVFVVNWLEKLD